MAYYKKLKSIWDELLSLNPILLCTCECKCGAAKCIQSIREREKVFDFLMVLDDVYSIVIDDVYSIVRPHIWSVDLC